MRRRLAGNLALVATLVGVAMAPAQATRISALSGAVDAALAAPPPPAVAIRAADTGGGLIRKGPFINRLSSPTITVQVLGTYDIFLAGQAYPSTMLGRFGRDLAGPNSPACLRVTVQRGSIVTITTVHGTSYRRSVPAAKDANGRVSQVITAGPAERGATNVGLSSIKAPIDGLVGVFIGKTSNQGPAPRALDFSSAKARDIQTIRPALNQVFYVGRGVTSKGKVKQIITPGGAAQVCFAPLNHAGASAGAAGVILAFVTGNESIANLFTLPPLAPTSPVPPSPTVSVTATFTTTVFPTDTPSNTRVPTGTPVPTNTFASVLLNGTPVLVNAQGTPVNNLGTPVVLTNALGTPINVQGTPASGGGGTGGGGGGTGGGTGGGGGGGGTGGGGGGGGTGGGGGGGAATGTTVPSATPTNTVSAATGTPTPSATGSTATGIPITLSSIWGQFQYDETHPGFDVVHQGQSTSGFGAIGNTNPNASPCSSTNTVCVQNMKLQWQSTPIADTVGNIIGGPVVGNENLYFSTPNGAIHCIDANTGYANVLDNLPCRDGFTAVSLGPLTEDNVPAVDPIGGVPGSNIVYVLSHNPPAPNTVAVTGGQAGGSLTAYNASTGAGLPAYNSDVQVNPSPKFVHPFLPTGFGVPVTVHGNVCYIPTLPYIDTQIAPSAVPGILHFLNCGPHGDGTELPLTNPPAVPVTEARLPDFNSLFPNVVTLAGTPLAGAVYDPANNQVIVSEFTGGTADVVEAFCAVGGCTGGLKSGSLAGTLAWAVPFATGGATAASQAFQPIVGRDPTLNATSTYVAFPTGLFAISNGTGAIKWSITNATAPAFFTPALAFTGFSPTSMPAFNPNINMIFVGANVLVGGSTPASVEVGIFANAGTFNGTPVTGGEVLWFFTQSGIGTVNGPPISDNGLATGTAAVVFFADSLGNVFALNATSGTALKTFSNAARGGATLVVIDGHLFFGGVNSLGFVDGRIFNYSF